MSVFCRSLHLMNISLEILECYAVVLSVNRLIVRIRKQSDQGFGIGIDGNILQLPFRYHVGYVGKVQESFALSVEAAENRFKRDTLALQLIQKVLLQLLMASLNIQMAL